MASWNDVRRVALALPETTETKSRSGTLNWSVRGKTFAWERPLRKADLAALGDAAPTGPILGLHTPDLELKEVLLASDPAAFFTTPHFDGYAAVLVRLEHITRAALHEVLVESWLVRAPKRLAAELLVKEGSSRP
jgi:hypothetical protein